MTIDMLLRALVLAVLGGLNVSLWTLRVALTAGGRRTAAAVVAGMDAVVFTLVFASVLSSLEAPLEVAGYGLGVAGGTLLGLLVNGKLTAGQSSVRCIVHDDGEALAAALERLGWPVTRLHGEGLAGAVTVLLVVADDGRVPALTADLERLAPAAFWTVERLQNAHAVPLPAGYRQVHPQVPHSSRRSWSPSRVLRSPASSTVARRTKAVAGRTKASQPT